MCLRHVLRIDGAMQGRPLLQPQPFPSLVIIVQSRHLRRSLVSCSFLLARPRKPLMLKVQTVTMSDVFMFGAHLLEACLEGSLLLDHCGTETRSLLFQSLECMASVRFSS
jgi:hypothetical protein